LRLASASLPHYGVSSTLSRWDKLDREISLNEGGWIIKNRDGTVRYVSISTADKSGVSLLLTELGTSTHSSMPRPDSAVFTLSSDSKRRPGLCAWPCY